MPSPTDSSNPAKLVLIVDDDENVRNLLEYILASSGKFRTATASDGAEALSAVRELRPAVMLLDVQLPDISGLDVMVELRKIADPPRVIVISANESKVILGRAYQLGARAFIQKPFTATNVIAKLDALILEPEPPLPLGAPEGGSVGGAESVTTAPPVAYLKTHRAKLSDILVSLDLITEDQRRELLRRCRENESDLGEIVVSEGLVPEEKYLKALSLRLNISYFTSLDGLLKREVGRRLTEDFSRRHLVAAAYESGGYLHVATLNPLDIPCFDEIERMTRQRVRPVLVTRGCLFEAIRCIYRDESSAARPSRAHALPPESRQGEERRPIGGGLPSGGSDDAAVELVSLLLQEGISRRASDIHVEPNDQSVRVRYRLDGMLQEGRNYPKEVLSSLVARVKILAKLDITETRLPQDGHLRVDHMGRPVDLRVSVIPTVNGEKLVLRILDSSAGLRTLDQLEIEPAVLQSLKGAIRSPNGLVLVTGPTGSGKTTTLYAIINDLNDATRNITTLEDPVEYRMRYVNQIEMHSRIGLNFASALRAVLRQDPNIILVGEIRDRETAEIAIQASITGHLVFSTLHTNDTIASIHRLINMDIPAFMICAALRGVLAQRLVRRLCSCRRTAELTAVDPFLAAYCRTGERFSFPVGCSSCAQTGYQGRLAVREWLPFGKTMRELVFQKASTDAMRSAARAEGMKTLLESGLDLARRGDTSLDEVLRVSREGE